MDELNGRAEGQTLESNGTMGELTLLSDLSGILPSAFSVDFDLSKADLAERTMLIIVDNDQSYKYKYTTRCEVWIYGYLHTCTKEK